MIFEMKRSKYSWKRKLGSEKFTLISSTCKVGNNKDKVGSEKYHFYIISHFVLLFSYSLFLSFAVYFSFPVMFYVFSTS